MDILIKVVLPLSLAFIMFSLGLGLTPADFGRVFKRPLAFSVGAFNQVVLLPLVAFGVIMAFGVTGALAVGFMILAACPGGVTSNIISRFAKADIALSVSLTAVISLISMFTVPLLMGWAFSYFLTADAEKINIARVALTMFALTVVPITIGVLTRLQAPRLVERTEATIARIASALFAIIVIAAVAGNWSLFVENLFILGPALIILNVLLLAVGFIVPKLLGLTNHEAKTVSIETGIQNSTLGITVAALIVAGEQGFNAYSLPAAVYGILMYFVTMPAVAWFRRLS